MKKNEMMKEFAFSFFSCVRSKARTYAGALAGGWHLEGKKGTALA